MSRGWVAAGAALALVSMAALLIAIRRVVETNRESLAASLPLVPRQSVRLGEPGPMVLHVEGPTGSPSFQGTSYRLLRGATGAEVPLERILVRTKVSGLGSSRVSLHSFDLPAPGDYLLEVSGVGPGEPSDRHRIVLTRDTRFRMIAQVGVIVLAAVGTIGGAVLALVAALLQRGR